MSELTFNNVSIKYPIYNSKAMSLRNQLVRIGTGGRIAGESNQIVTVTALENVSFSLKDGDSVGLIGHNGAGKSTLLRTMAGIYEPSSGEITRSGTVATVFEIGAGMDPELSGYENIIRMGLLMGMTLGEISGITKDVEDFTELGDFLNLPVRTYSSGMTMRLMFAVATSCKPSILLVDEMFGTGDAAFQEKAKKRMQQLISDADIFVFASHDHNLVKSLCKRIFHVEHGKITETSSKDLP